MMRISVDHLVYATPDLARGMREVELLTGVAPTLGGQHPGRGTRNALIALGDDSYLEIVGPDDDQLRPVGGRWLGVDVVTNSRLTTWAVRSNDVPGLRRRALESGVPLGEVRHAERQRADGVRLSWQLTDPDPLVAGGVIPFFIDWGASPHPSRSAPHGATLLDLRVEHPDPSRIRRMFRALDLDVVVTDAESAALVAVIDGPRGWIELR
ncbi:MAG TPA: VOC family protein [Vicinamibacterales bacterium]